MNIQATANLFEDIAVAMKQQPNDGYNRFQIRDKHGSGWIAPHSWTVLVSYLATSEVPTRWVRKRPPVVEVHGEIPVETIEAARAAYRFNTAGSAGYVIAEALLDLAGDCK